MTTTALGNAAWTRQCVEFFPLLDAQDLLVGCNNLIFLAVRVPHRKGKSRTVYFLNRALNGWFFRLSRYIRITKFDQRMLLRATGFRTTATVQKTIIKKNPTNTESNVSRNALCRSLF